MEPAVKDDHLSLRREESPCIPVGLESWHADRGPRGQSQLWKDLPPQRVHQAKEEAPEGSAPSPLQPTLRENSGLTPLAFIVFTLVYMPCLGTVDMIFKETRSWAWTGFSVGYGIGLGWVLAWLTVVAGRALGFA